MTLQDVMQYCRNYFPDDEHRKADIFTISDGKLQAADTLGACRFFLIEGSHLNDGVYDKEDYTLQDEIFAGVVTPLCVPPDFIALVEKMQAWETQYEEASRRPFQSESFDGYSYTKASGTNGGLADWRTIWSAELNRYRKI